jgi:hypothetical protein
MSSFIFLIQVKTIARTNGKRNKYRWIFSLYVLYNKEKSKTFSQERNAYENPPPSKRRRWRMSSEKEVAPR